MKSLLLLILILSTSSLFSKASVYESLSNISVSQSGCFKYFQLNDNLANNILLNEVGKNYQLNIWKHRSENSLVNADQLESTLEDILINGAILADEPIGIGVSGARLLELDNEVKGVFKVGDNWASDITSEIAAYKVDKIFNFDLVPITVQRKIGNEKGSVQLFVSEAKMASEVKSAIIIKENRAKLEILDYLILNSDRHKDNYLISQHGKIIAIDHGISFNNSSHAYKSKRRPIFTQKVFDYLGTQEGKKLMSVLKSTTDKEIKKELRGILKEKNIRSLIIRKNFIIGL